MLLPFLIIGSIKSARYGAFDNKELEEMVSGPEKEEVTHGHYEEFSYELMNKKICNYLFLPIILNLHCLITTLHMGP